MLYLLSQNDVVNVLDTPETELASNGRTREMLEKPRRNYSIIV
jgi:hypothetical protein